MIHEFPRGILIAGGATSQLLGVALHLYFLEKNKFLEILYVKTKMAHTQGFLFGYAIQAKEIQVQGRIEKYLPRFMWSYENLIRRVSNELRRLTFFFVHPNRVSNEIDLSIEVNGRAEIVGTWDTRSGMITGGISPGIIRIAAPQIKELFSKLTFSNPFDRLIDNPKNIAIHYRLGDMRSNPYWRKTHGVLDPSVILKELYKISESITGHLPRIVYSDEPQIAKLLLESVGLFDCEYVNPSDIWSDIQKMSNSTFFIGSFSTVSMVVAEIRSFYNYPPSNLPINCRKHTLSHQTGSSDYFKARILPLRHWVYKIPSSI
jgi:hypothetical protein